MLPIPYYRAWLLATIAILACLTLGISAAAGDEPEGGGGEGPPTTETPVEPPTESEPPPTETTPTEPETTTESPKTTPESPHPTETTSESPSPGPAPSTPSSQTPSGSSPTPSHHHSSGGSHAQPQHTTGGAGKGIKVPNPLKSITSGVDSIISGALAPQQIDKVGELLAKSGLAPRGNKKAQHQAARKIINALGAAALSSGIGLSPPKAAPAPQPIPFVPIHGGPKYLPIALLMLLLGGVGIVLFYQLRPVIRSRQPRPPLISGIDTGPGSGPGPGRVSLPRDPARAPARPNPARRKTR